MRYYLIVGIPMGIVLILKLYNEICALNLFGKKIVKAN